METYVISLLQKRPNKIQEFKVRCPKELNTTVYDGVDGSNEVLPLWWNQKMKGSYGCYLSHINILKLVNGLTLILEDDAVFCDNFIEKLSRAIRHVPDDWDQLYIGGQHLGSRKSMNNYIEKGTNINRTHGYFVKNKDSANKLLSNLLDKDFWIKNLNKNKYHIDYAYGIMHKQNIINAYASKPFLIGQAANSYSDTGSQISTVVRWWN
jgi:GR25 family glycosyltransferase involved in LPS biosynthesis